MPSRPIPQTDAEFEARLNANTLIEARKIEADPKKRNAAIAQAKLIKEDEQARARAASAVANMKTKAISKSRSRKRA